MATSKKKANVKSVQPAAEAPKAKPEATASGGIVRTLEAGDPKKAKALLLSCMDLRVIDETALLMTELGLHNKYDHVAIAGSALGVLTASYRGAGSRFEVKNGVADIRHFGRNFWTHVDLAIALHQIDKVIIVEHADCGAYKHFVKGGTLEAPIKTKTPPAECRKVAKNLVAEVEQHRWYANELKRIIETVYAKTYVAKGDAKPGLTVDICLVTPWMSLATKARK